MFSTITTYLLLLVVMSVITFLAYGWDKRQAKLNGLRTPEKTLQTLAFLGGWPGAILAQQFFRHKTRKVSFQITFWLIVAVHGVLAGLWIAGADLGPVLNELGLKPSKPSV